MSDLAILLVPYYNTHAASAVRPYCLNYTNSSGELASTRFIHGTDGLMTKALYQQITGQRSSVNSHEFDADGRMVRKFREYNDGETSEELFQYDGSGRLTSESFTNSKGEAGKAFYEYDGDGNAALMRCEGYKGWFHGTIQFAFDKAGKRVSASIRNDGKPVGSIDYRYEGGTNLVLETWKLDSGWSQTVNYVYEPLD